MIIKTTRRYHLKLEELGDKIKKLRKAQNLTQQELATLAGISRVTLGKLERGQMGNISLRSMDIIVDKLGYELELSAKKSRSFGLPTLDEIAKGNIDATR
jgi:transcriptional regulator with XRE-family HTH domain